MLRAKSERGYRLGIVNPLTLVGTEIQTILQERAFPYAKLMLLDSTGEVAGTLSVAGDESAVEDGKLVVAGVNLDEGSEGDHIIISPHPVAIPITLILHQIMTASPIELCTATVVQPASEFDQKGLEELARQTISVLNIQSVPKEVFDRQLAFNLYPAPEHNEDFIVGQVRALTDPRIELALLITQGAIFHSHRFSLFIRTRAPLDRAAVVKALNANNAIGFAEGDQSLGTIDAAGRDEVLIAEVRPEASVGSGFWVWAVCDNLRRSAALNAVLIAEKVLLGTHTN